MYGGLKIGDVLDLHCVHLNLARARSSEPYPFRTLNMDSTPSHSKSGHGTGVVDPQQDCRVDWNSMRHVSCMCVWSSLKMTTTGDARRNASDANVLVIADQTSG